MSNPDLDFIYKCNNLYERDFLIKIFKQSGIHIESNYRYTDNFPPSEMCIAMYEFGSGEPYLYTCEGDFSDYDEYSILNYVEGLIDRVNLIFNTRINPYITVNGFYWIKKQ